MYVCCTICTCVYECTCTCTCIMCECTVILLYMYYIMTVECCLCTCTCILCECRMTIQHYTRTIQSYNSHWEKYNCNKRLVPFYIQFISSTIKLCIRLYLIYIQSYVYIQTKLMCMYYEQSGK